MFRNRKKRLMPELNTTSTADISFMLLTFFLVTTSMDSDHGLPRQLPPMPKPDEQQEVEMNKRDVMNVSLDAADRLTCDGQPVTLAELGQRVESFADDRHVISVQADAHTTYDAYFQMQNAIVKAYNRLRDREARAKYGHPYRQCSPDEREAIGKKYPMRISEAEPTEAALQGKEVTQ